MEDCFTLSKSLIKHLLDNLTTWPFVIFVVFVVFIIKYKKQTNDILEEIKKLIGRVKTVHLGNNIAEFEQQNFTHVRNPLEGDTASSPNETTNLLKLYEFEKIYNVIFGSQIAVLIYVNSLGPQPTNNLKVFYGVYSASRSSLLKIDFHQYLSFLVDSSLLEFTENKNKVSVTDKGNDFIKYILETHKSTYTNKPL